jgi:hypothetical protein
MLLRRLQHRLLLMLLMLPLLLLHRPPQPLSLLPQGGLRLLPAGRCWRCCGEDAWAFPAVGRC